MSALTASLQATPIVNQPPATATTPSTSASTSTNEFNSLNAQSFMQLLTAELQNQDPTDPVDESQLAGEMAEFSTATGINTLNTNVKALLNTQSANQLAGASALIGKQVATPGDALVSDSSGAATGAFDLSGPATNVAVHVMDAAGNTVGMVPLGTLGGGVHAFNWSAPSPNTAYTFTVSAAGASGSPVQASPMSLYTVSGVAQSNGSLNLALAGNPNPLPVSQVQQVL